MIDSIKAQAIIITRFQINRDSVPIVIVDGNEISIIFKKLVCDY